VTLDPKAGKVLVVYNRHLQILQLPKGRRHVAEDWLTAALRETEEETGVRASLLPLRIATRATLPAQERCRNHHANTIPKSAGEADQDMEKDEDIVDDRATTEFVGVCRYPDPQSRGGPADKTVYFFAGVADSTLPPGKGAPEAHEKLESRWMGVPEAREMLAFGAERQILEKVLSDARRTGVVVMGA
jgi:8-oxo-dGTP pyrophosphatase MutT (NUDIX family)